MTTCTYCNCEVEPRDAGWGEDFYRHRDTWLCIKALKRRVAELESALADERSYAATLEDRLELYTGNPPVDREAPVTQTAED